MGMDDGKDGIVEVATDFGLHFWSSVFRRGPLPNIPPCERRSCTW